MRIKFIKSMGKMKSGDIFELMSSSEDSNANNLFIKLKKNGERGIMNNNNLVGISNKQLEKWKDNGTIIEVN